MAGEDDPAPGLDRWRAFYVDTVANPSRLAEYMLSAGGERLEDADSLVILALVPMVAVLRDQLMRHHQDVVPPRLTLVLPAACWLQPEVVSGGRLLDMPMLADPRVTWPSIAVELP